MGRYIRIDEDGKVYSVRYGKAPVADEIENDEGEIGAIMQQDGTFTMPEPEPVTPGPTFEEQVGQALERIDARLAKIEGVAAEQAEA